MKTTTTKVFNLTDVSTPELAQRKLVGHTFAIGRAMVTPGGFAEVTTDQVHAMSGIQELVRLGVAAVGEPPAQYLVAKAQQKPPAPAQVAQPPQPAPRAAGRTKEVLTAADVGPVPAALLTPEKGK